MEFSADVDIDKSDYRTKFSLLTTPSRYAVVTTRKLEISSSRPSVSSRKQRWGKDESTLIERLKDGDEKALEVVFYLYSPKLYNVAHKILGEAADTEEVIQDVYWTAYRKAKTFRGNSRFFTWLYRLTTNAALGRIRQNRKHKMVEYEKFQPKFQEDGHHLARPLADWSTAPDEDYAKRELRQILEETLDQLKPIDKTVVVLKHLEGLSGKEVAAALGVTVSAVKMRLHRARLFLRGKLAVRLGQSPI